MNFQIHPWYIKTSLFYFWFYIISRTVYLIKFKIIDWTCIYNAWDCMTLLKSKQLFFNNNWFLVKVDLNLFIILPYFSMKFLSQY